MFAKREYFLLLSTIVVLLLWFLFGVPGLEELSTLIRNIVRKYTFSFLPHIQEARHRWLMAILLPCFKFRRRWPPPSLLLLKLIHIRKLSWVSTVIIQSFLIKIVDIVIDYCYSIDIFHFSFASIFQLIYCWYFFMGVKGNRWGCWESLLLEGGKLWNGWSFIEVVICWWSLFFFK